MERSLIGYKTKRRKVGNIVSLPGLCMGFWTGLITWFLGQYADLFMFSGNIITGFLLSLLSSGSVYLLDRIIDDEGIRINLKGNKE